MKCDKPGLHEVETVDMASGFLVSAQEDTNEVAKVAMQQIIFPASFWISLLYVVTKLKYM